MTHHLEPILGFSMAGISTATLWLAESAPAVIEPALQTGGTIGLIGGLSVALVAVWRDRKELAQQLKDSEAARLEDQKAVNVQYRLDMEKADLSRGTLIREIQEQTRAIRDK